MSETKKPAKSRKKPIAGVDKPDDSKPVATSKPVIVTNRPILKDPMMADEAAKPDDDGKKTDEKTELAHSTAPIVKPLEKSIPEPAKPQTAEEKPAPEETKPEAEPEPKTEDKPPAAKPANPSQEKSDAETAEQTKREAAIQHLIDSKKYELPINAVEKRKSKRFVVLGIVLAILLVLAWGDIAADAGIIHISGLKPVTHFFTN